MKFDLLVHMPVDRSHGYIEFLRQIERRFPILSHITNLLDLVRCELVIALRTFFEALQILHGDQPVPADLDGRQAFITNEGKYALWRNAQDFTGLLRCEKVHGNES